LFRSIIKQKSRDFSKEACFNEAFNNAYKAFATTLLKGNVEDIFNDNKINDSTQKSPFWVCATALHRYYQANNTFPLAGSLPDMTSTTDYYLDM